MFAFFRRVHEGAEVRVGTTFDPQAGQWKRFVRQRAHLEVDVLAGVFFKSVRKGDYLLKRLHDDHLSLAQISLRTLWVGYITRRDISPG